MRLVTVRTATGSRAGVAHGDRAVLVPALAGAAPYEDVGALLRDGAAGMDAARGALASGGVEIALGPANILRPILRPGAVVCVGLNYRSHILEMGRDLPTDPTLFSKLPRAMTDPFADIELPGWSDRADYEGELAAVIGTGGRDIAAADAWYHVAGLTVLNDVTLRDYQRRTLQWFAGKTLFESTPFGPAVVTRDEVGDLEAAELRVTVNGEERQRAALGELVFGVPSLVADISKIVPLEAGDLIATGTPGGVGQASERFLGDGDVVEVGIDGIGTIRNTFRRPC